MYKDSPRVDMWNTTAAVFAATLHQGKNYDEVKTFGFKSETLKTFQIEFDKLYFLSFQNLTRCKVFNWKWCLSKSMKFSKKWDLHLAIGIETRFFERLFFFWKTVRLKLLIQNLTRCEKIVSKADAFFLNSKSDILYFFYFKNWQDETPYSKSDAV